MTETANIIDDENGLTIVLDNEYLSNYTYKDVFHTIGNDGILTISGIPIESKEITNWDYSMNKERYLRLMEKIDPKYVEEVQVETGYLWWKKTHFEKQIKFEFRDQRRYELKQELQPTERIEFITSNFLIK